MIVAAFVVSMGQLRTELLSGVMESRREQQAFTRVHGALMDNAELADLHRGFEAFLDARPEVGLGERAYQELLLLPSFRDRVDAFEEKLRAKKQSGLFRRYYRALGKDPDARSAVEALMRLEVREGARDVGLRDALAYLKGHPSTALDFLAHPNRLVPTPEALWPLRNRLRRDDALRKELLQLFTELDRSPAAHGAVYPWWEAAYLEEDETSEADETYRALEDYLVRFPSRLWTWHRRNLVWSDYRGAEEWRDYWYGRIRRDENLGGAYFTYVNALRDEPALEESVEDTLLEAHGLAPAWPPAAPPPDLPPWPSPDEAIAEPERPRRPDPPRPERPNVPEPDRGRLPRPGTPDQPELGKPPE